MQPENCRLLKLKKLIENKQADAYELYHLATFISTEKKSLELEYKFNVINIK
jgi:hypothetical protein